MNLEKAYKTMVKTAEYTAIFMFTLIAYTAFSTLYLDPESPATLVKAVTRIDSVSSKITPQMRFDSIRHGIVGLLIGSLTLDPSYTLFSALTSVLIDVDHIPYFTGLHVPARISHSLFMCILGATVLYLYSRDVRVSFVLASSFLCHISLDNFLVPIFSPISEGLAPRWLSTPILLFMPIVNIAVGIKSGNYSRLNVKTLQERIGGLLNGRLRFR